MGGFREDVLSHVNLIADNLRDRYASGFPILKELIQNADDATATTLDLVLTEGIAEAQNPLLHGPALVCINDGPFQQRHARGIVHIALGSKAADQSAIGKFGLGQKSVFHFCEAFLFMASPDPEEDKGEYPRRDVLNPWFDQRKGGDPDHGDWDTFCVSDQALVERQLSPLLSGTQWFVLWLPLRTAAHRRRGGGVIVEYYPSPSELDRLLTAEEPLALLLPGLSSVQRIRYFRHQADHRLERVYEVALAPGSARLPRRTKANASSSQAIKGDVTIASASPTPKTVVFAGHEILCCDEQTEVLQRSELWPRTPYRDSVTGHGSMVPEKALPQGAAILTRAKATAGGRLAIRWAVFLPVGDAAYCEAPCPGDFDYELSLHGYFFLDSGRKNIEALEASNVSERPAATEQDIRARWNAMLRDRATLPNIPSAVYSLAKAKRMTRDDVKALCQAIRETTLFARHAAAICLEDALVLRVTPDGQEWCRIPVGTAVRALPEPPEGATARPWSTLPALSDLVGDVALTWYGAPNLRHPDPYDAWTVEEVGRLLDSRSAVAFRSRSSVEYLAAFLEQNRTAANSASVRAALANLLRHVLAQAGPSPLTRAKVASTSITSLLLPRDILFLRQVSDAEVYQALAGSDTRVLVLPEELRRQEGEPPAPWCSLEDAISLLGCLDTLIRQSGEVADEAARAAEQILLAAAGTGASLNAPEIRDLKVIRAWRAKTNRREALSISELLQRADAGTLFRDRMGNLDAARAKQLQAALPAADVVIIRPEAADLLRPREVPPLTSLSLLDAVGRATQFGDVPARRALLEELLRDWEPSRHARAMRLLLHADPTHADDTSALWDAVDKKWDALAGQLLTQKAEGWRLVHRDLAAQLNARQRDALGVRTLSDRDILEMLDRRTDQELAALELSAFQRDSILDLVENETLWKRLPFHRTKDGTFTAIDAQCFLPSPWAVPPSLATHVKLLQSTGGAHASAMRLRLVEPWSPKTQLDLCLSQHEPADLWRDIVHALSGIELRTSPFEASIRRLRCTLWLPLQDGGSIAPQDILELPKQVSDAAAAALGQGEQPFRTPSALPREIEQHQSIRKYADLLFSSGEEALQGLALQLESAPALRIAFASGPRFPIEDAVLVQGLDTFPGWRLLRAVAEAFGPASAEQRILPALSGHFVAADTVPFLNGLSLAHEAAGRDETSPALQVFDYYFDQLCGLSQWGDALSAIRLRNALGEWREAGELTAEVDNIEPAHIVHHRYRTKLRRASLHQGREEDCTTPLLHSVTLDAGDEAHSVHLLEDYFDRWTSSVPHQKVGILIGLLGQNPNVRKLAGTYLTPHTQAWIVDTIKVLNLFGWTTFKKAFDALRPVIRVQRDSRITVVSITGDVISVPVSAIKPDSTIFVGAPRNAMFPTGGQATVLTLYRLPVEQLETEQIAELLRRSVEYLLDEVYVFPPSERAHIIDALLGAENDDGQADISAARASIVDHIEIHLRQLGASKHPAVWDFIRAIEAAEARKNEASPADRDARFHELQAVREELATHIERDEAARAAVLEGVRRRLTKYQYYRDRVPFELFQNADDAVIELSIMNSAMGLAPDEEAIPAPARRFRVEVDEANLRLIHWGRPINYFVARGFNGKERGFHLDLRKMLSIGHSDKEGGNETTGEFGLGFKSVHLVTSQPAFISRFLKVEVIGGLLPCSWRHDRAVARHHWMDRSAPPTVFDVPLDVDVKAADVVREFERLHGILPAFAKAIRSVELAGPTSSTAHWVPAPVPGVDGVTVGEVRVPEARGALRSVRALKLSQSDTAILLTLGARGIESFPDNVPTIWRTAPTREEWRAGYCINGPFQLDVGRTQLPPDSDGNLELVARMGDELGSQLRQLYEAAVQDWPTMAHALSLSPEPFSRDELWVSLWDVLSSGFTSDGSKVLRALHGNGKGLSHLATRCPVVPTGLNGPFRGLVTAHSVRGSVSGLLALPDVQKAATAWPGLREWLSSGAVVTREVAIRLEQMGFDQMPEIKLFEVLRATIEGGVVTPSLANALGTLLTRGWLDEHADSAERWTLLHELKRFAFFSESGEAVTANRLLVGRGAEPEFSDERSRARFAPGNRVLSSDYNTAGRAFFSLCRGDLVAPADELTAWIIAATAGDQRLAALAYVLDGELGQTVAMRLGRTNSGFWLHSRDEVMQLPLLALWEESRRWDLASKLFPPHQWEVQPLQVSLPMEVIDAATHLAKIKSWWSSDREQWITKYEVETYPDGLPPDSLSDPSSVTGRRDWLVLLTLGSLMRMGRTQRGQHRRFLEICEDRGWWRVFSEVDPRDGATQWLDILESFADLQVQDEHYAFWMREFSTIHRFARWLPVYAQTFLRLGARREAFDLSVVLTPRADPALTGAGGFDAPPINRSLGLGACFVVRELNRLALISGELTHRYCFTPTAAVRRLLKPMGLTLFTGADTAFAQSRAIHEFLVTHLGSDGARFDGDSDLPLVMLADHRHGTLQQEVFGRIISEAEEDDSLSIEIPEDHDTDVLILEEPA